MMLSDSETSANEDEHQFTINEHYAKAYQARKEREELQQLKDKYGSDFEEGGGENADDDGDEETDSESAESEDEDGEELTPVVDAAILRTLAMIKRKDPSIYQSERDIYQEEQQKVTNVVHKKKVKDKSKPITLRQAALEASLLNPNASRSPSPEPQEPTHVEEQRALRDETIAAFHGAVTREDDVDEEENTDGDDDDGGGLLVPREKTKDELEREEEEYKSFLQKEVGADLKDLITVEKMDDEASARGEDKSSEDGKKKKKKKKKKKGKESKSKTKDEEDHEFLMNYILNRGWIDKSTRHIPTYKEIVTPKNSTPKPKPEAAGVDYTKNTQDHAVNGDDSGAESDTSFESLLDHFEASYNFRFEEPGAATIQIFPRQLPDTVRRQESTRKDARARKRERKQAELEQKREEVKRLKSLKMKEMRKKLERIGREGGRGKDLDEDHALQHLDLDGDWDPQAHDKQMAELYGNDQGALVDNDKPMWDDDIDIGDIIAPIDNYYQGEIKDKKKKKKKKRKDDSDDDEGGVDVDEMDADVVREDVGQGEEEEWDGTEEMRKRKLKEYMNELNALDFNDMVGSMPTRFRYVPIKAESFALTPTEILMATDLELNQYMSVKKYAPYRHGTKWDSQRNEKLRELKQAIAQRIAKAGADGEWVAGYDEGEGGKGRGDAAGRGGGEKPVKKRKGRKERMKAKAATTTEANENGEQDEQDAERGHQKKRKHEQVDISEGEPPSRHSKADSAEEVPSKKRKRRHKKKSEANEVAA